MRAVAMISVVGMMGLASLAMADGVRITGAPISPPAGNDFSDDLPRLLMQDVSLLLTERSRLTFTAVAAESGNHNTLTVQGLGSLTEDRDFGFNRNRFRRAGRMVGVFSPGPLDPMLLFTSDFGDAARPGSANFGIYADGAPGDEFTTFYLVYDDTLEGDADIADSDFDDYIIRVDVEPVN